MKADVAARLTAEFGAVRVDSCTASWRGAAMTWPRLTVADVESAAAALRFAAGARLRVLPAGAATHLHGAPGGGVADFVLSLRQLDQVLEYEPEDMVAVVQAGVPLATLDALAAPHAQRLGPDPWMGAGATVGGAVAANRYALARRSRGTWRDAVLGLRVVHADGRGSKTGGKVVKNVTGFDLAKLYVGSGGTLVLLTEINLRLAPRPSQTATVAAVVTPGACGALFAAIAGAACAPASCTAVQGGWLAAWSEILPPAGADAVAVVLQFEGRDAVVAPQVEIARRLTGGELLATGRAGALETALRSACEARPPHVTVRIRALPSVLPAVLAACHDELGTAAGVLGFIGAGEVLVHAAELPAARAGAWAARVQALGGRMSVEAGAGAGFPAAGFHDAAAAALHRDLRRALDPDGVFAVPSGLPGERE